jgi:hypothetical protein
MEPEGSLLCSQEPVMAPKLSQMLPFNAKARTVYNLNLLRRILGPMWKEV